MAVLGGLMDRLGRGTDHDLYRDLAEFSASLPSPLLLSSSRGRIREPTRKRRDWDCGLLDLRIREPRNRARLAARVGVPTRANELLGAALQAHREVGAYGNANRLAGELEA